MKKACLILISCLSFFQAFAQGTVVSEPKKLQQLYFGFGAGPTLTFSEDLEKFGLTLFSHLNLSYSETIFFRGGLNFSRFSDNLNRYPELTYQGDLPPHHEITSYYLGIGKRKQLGNSFLIQATAGISYNRHSQPDNIRYKPNYGFGFVGNADPFEYEIKRENKPGFIVQGEILGGKGLRSGGISLGSFFHYVPKASHFGATLALNFGLLSKK